MITLVIPGRLPGMNEITDAARGNRYIAAKMKKEYTEMVALYAMAAKLPRMEKVDVMILWHEPDKMRDKDNIHAGIKFILDGLVKAGIIPNDNWAHIGDITHKFDVDRRNPRIEVILEEVQA